MIGFGIAETARRLGAEHIGKDGYFNRVSTDTRTLLQGDLFIALHGPRFDGHEYLEQARERGACAAMVEREAETALPLILLADTRIGLGRLAGLWRDASRARLVAITGSNGKTTVKEMLAAILSREGRVLATQGNLNNDIGMPLTLLGLQEEEYAVIEMGANHPGEIGYLSRIARPDVAVLNNAGRAHLEGFGSLEGVARAKAEILDGLSPAGCFVYNADDAFAPLWRELAGSRMQRTFGLGEAADVFSPADDYRLAWHTRGFESLFKVVTDKGAFDVRLQLAGRHNRMNALAAIAAAQAMGVSTQNITAGLADLEPVAGRLQHRQGAGGVVLIDDSYNANPESVGAAIDVLASAPQRRVLVLGELAELGDGVERFYRELGERAAAAGVTAVFALGDAAATAAAYGNGFAFKDCGELIARLRDYLHEGDVVLVKGSNASRMGRVVDALAAEGVD